MKILNKNFLFSDSYTAQKQNILRIWANQSSEKSYEYVDKLFQILNFLRESFNSEKTKIRLIKIKKKFFENLLKNV